MWPRSLRASWWQTRWSTPTPRPSWYGAGSQSALRVAVTDLGDSVLVVERDRQLGDGGRGLPLVDALSASWGVTHLVLGKTVWFTLQAPPPAR